MHDNAWDYIDGRFLHPPVPDGEVAQQDPSDLDLERPPLPYAHAHVEAAVTAARAAQPGFARLGHDARAELLTRYKAEVKAHRDAIAQTISQEVGKPLWEARTEADALATKVDLCLGPGAAFTATEDIPSLPGQIRHRPLGVVAVVGPFNFPGHLPNGQILPALLAGNTVVHKPSERTPGTARWIAVCLERAGLPKGVFNVVQGPGPIGSALCAHRDVDGVLFTGSARVGRVLVAGNLDRLDRLIALELGGKNASIALQDCHLEATARAVAFSAYVTAGQRCTATSRLIVQRAIAEPLCERIAELAQGLRIGHPAQPDTFMGPLISEQARTHLWKAQAAARSEYEERVAGGQAQVPGRRGYYVKPALRVARTAHTHLAGYSDEELFGPDLAVYVVDDLDEAVAVANASRFGLAASIFTNERSAFEHVAEGLRVGLVSWNRPSAGASGRLPFGGVGESGNLRAAGIHAGLCCTFPLSVLLEPAGGPGPASWPGFPA
ncbi:MAG: aldehyde dehydrogenase family protein [Myxococcales bacterium]|nr:aldehyde dehydrogenase family protein [Myxococcales bacterium]MDD9965567.1 aldehyde dehydrogenase family protein [Myxococcales bacterium]